MDFQPFVSAGWKILYKDDTGCLIIDDVIIRKPFGKNIFPTTYVYDHTNNSYIWRMHIVVLICSSGWFKIPICFRIWIPKQKCEIYHTKLELVMDMINFAHKFGLQAEYVTFDTWYSSKALLTLLKNCNYHYIYMLKNNRKVIYKNGISLNVKTVSLLFNKKQYRFYPAAGFFLEL